MKVMRDKNTMDGHASGLSKSIKRYGAIDGLRAIACVGIVMMHIRANNNYAISGFVYDSVITSFTNFVFLFMVISAFGMCCGYYENMLNGTISLEKFYKKRYMKILPFFTLLVLLDIAITRTSASFCEGFVDVTLLFGLFPNNITVIGVGWFLGLVFAFYLIFPFYCVLIQNRKRAWAAFGISLLLNFVLGTYFEVERDNIVYSLCYFLAGGLIYLYREKMENISRKYQGIAAISLLAGVVLYYTIGANTVTMLLVSCLLLIFALGQLGGALQNRVTQFLASISMEIYLAHMVIFRVIEKLGLNTILGNGWLQYGVTVAVVLAGTVVFSIVIKKAIKAAGKKIGWGR